MLYVSDRYTTKATNDRVTHERCLRAGRLSVHRLPGGVVTNLNGSGRGGALGAAVRCERARLLLLLLLNIGLLLQLLRWLQRVGELRLHGAGRAGVHRC